MISSTASLIATLAGSSHKITMIKGSSSSNVEDYGIALAEAHVAGLDLDTFEKEIAAFEEKNSEPEKNKKSLKKEILEWAKTLVLYCFLPLAVFLQLFLLQHLKFLVLLNFSNKKLINLD